MEYIASRLQLTQTKLLENFTRKFSPKKKRITKTKTNRKEKQHNNNNNSNKNKISKEIKEKCDDFNRKLIAKKA